MRQDDYLLKQVKQDIDVISRELQWIDPWTEPEIFRLKQTQLNELKTQLAYHR